MHDELLETYNMTIAVSLFLCENNKYYLQVLSDKYLYQMNNIKMQYYDRIDVSEIKQVHQKSVTFVTICIFLNKVFKFQLNVCNRCYDLLMIFRSLSDIAI